MSFGQPQKAFSPAAHRLVWCALIGSLVPLITFLVLS